MNFEYNGNLLENDRIELVIKEIIGKYPQIDISKAKEAALLEGKISSDKTLNMELERLYNIMLVNSDNKSIVTLIYKDFIDIINNNQDISDNYYYISEKIMDFLNGEDEFPFIEE